ncbi:MAG: PH domain-containing protein [Phycisphaerales bacterium]
MTEERILLEASFTPEAIKYHCMSATIGSAVIFVILAVVLIIPTIGFSLILLAVPAVVWMISQWYYKLYFEKLSCVLTARKLKIGKGLLFRSEKAIPLDKITDMQMNQGPLMRYLDLESMKVETAGNAGSAGGALVSLVGIRDSRDFREAVLTQRDRVVGSQDVSDRPAPAPAANAESSASGGSASESLAVLAEIRDTLSRIEIRLNERD